MEDLLLTAHAGTMPQPSASWNVAHLLSELVCSRGSLLEWLTVLRCCSLARNLPCLLLLERLSLLVRNALCVWATWTYSVLGYQVYRFEQRLSACFGVVLTFVTSGPGCFLLVW